MYESRIIFRCTGSIIISKQKFTGSTLELKFSEDTDKN